MPDESVKNGHKKKGSWGDYFYWFTASFMPLAMLYPLKGWRELGWFSKDGSDSPKAEGSQGTLRWSRLESFVVVAVLLSLQVDFSKEVFQEHQDACDLAGCWKSSSFWLTCCSDHCAYCEKYKCWMWRWRSKVMRMLAFGTHFQTQRSLLSVPKKRPRYQENQRPTAAAALEHPWFQEGMKFFTQTCYVAFFDGKDLFAFYSVDPCALFGGAVKASGFQSCSSDGSWCSGQRCFKMLRFEKNRKKRRTNQAVDPETQNISTDPFCVVWEGLQVDVFQELIDDGIVVGEVWMW